MRADRGKRHKTTKNGEKWARAFKQNVEPIPNRGNKTKVSGKSIWKSAEAFILPGVVPDV